MPAKALLLSVGLLGLAQVSTAAGRAVPENLKALYDSAKSNRCGNPLSDEFEDGHGKSGWVYCGDHLDSNGIVYLTGPSNSEGLADMDIDCDGANNSAGDCANDPSGQGQTAFKHEVQDYGIEDLDSNKHSFVVLGNEGESPEYMPTEAGVESLSVVAVVCNNKLFYGVWGDTNGGVVIGETSISLAQACFPDEGLNGDNGHSEHDVLYVAFSGSDAKPGADGADWDASGFEAFEESLANIGDELVSKISI